MCEDTTRDTLTSLTELARSNATTHRLRREALEQAEGTPRARQLEIIAAAELLTETLADDALCGAGPERIGSLRDGLLLALNMLHLAISPEQASVVC